MSDDYAEELRAAQAAAFEAGAVLERFAAEGVRYGVKRSGRARREVVSEADLAADGAIHRILHASFPEDGWLSEEQPDDRARLAQSRVWIVDPLDGTREYLNGVPEYAVSIALAVDGVPVLGVVYNSAHDEMTAGVVGQPGPWALSEAERLADTFVLVGRGEWSSGALPPLPRGTEVMPVGSVAYRMALLARGTGADLHHHAAERVDLAAGVALLTAAGAEVTTLDGAPLRFNEASTRLPGFVAGNAHLTEEARAFWRRKRAEIGRRF